MNRGNEPEEKQADKQGRRQHRLLQDTDDAVDERMLDDAAQRRRHAALEGCSRPGQGEQQRAQMVQSDVLHPIEQELMLGKILEARFEHGVDDEEAGEEADPPRQARPFRGSRRQGQAADEPPGRQPDREKFNPGEFPRRPRRQRRNLAPAQPPKGEAGCGDDAIDDTVRVENGLRKGRKGGAALDWDHDIGPAAGALRLQPDKPRRRCGGTAAHRRATAAGPPVAGISHHRSVNPDWRDLREDVARRPQRVQYGSSARMAGSNPAVTGEGVKRDSHCALRRI